MARARAEAALEMQHLNAPEQVCTEPEPEAEPEPEGTIPCTMISALRRGTEPEPESD